MSGQPTSSMADGLDRLVQGLAETTKAAIAKATAPLAERIGTLEQATATDAALKMIEGFVGTLAELRQQNEALLEQVRAAVAAQAAAISKEFEATSSDRELLWRRVRGAERELDALRNGLGA